MTPGVSFQPSSPEQEQQNQPTNGRPPGSPHGVQEAIKVLSLRLPKVVGAQAVAPSALLKSSGSGGRPHVDSVVQQVLQKYFPNNAQANVPVPTASAQPAGMPDFNGLRQAYGAPQPQPRREVAAVDRGWQPRVIVTPPTGPVGDFTVGGDGRPTQPGQPPSQLDGNGVPGGIIAPLPDDLRQQLDWLFRPSFGGGPSEPSGPEPLF